MKYPIRALLMAVFAFAAIAIVSGQTHAASLSPPQALAHTVQTQQLITPVQYGFCARCFGRCGGYWGSPYCRRCKSYCRARWGGPHYRRYHYYKGRRCVYGPNGYACRY